MNGLKAKARELVSLAREWRRSGYPVESARCLDKAGEYRRSLFYVYGGNRS